MSEEIPNMAIRDLKHYVIDNMSLDVQDDFEIICKYITNLQQKVEQLENKSQILQENNKLLIQQKAQMYEDLDNISDKLEQLENIRKEAIEYITSEEYFDLNNHKTGSFVEDSNNYLKAHHILLNILNKGSDKE